MNTDIKVKLIKTQAKELQRRSMNIFEMAFAEEIKNNTQRDLQGVEQLAIEQLVNNALTATKRHLDNVIRAHNYDEDYVLTYLTPELIERCKDLIKGNRGLSAVDAKFAAIKAAKKLEKEEGLENVVSKLRKFGYEVNVSDNMVDVSGQSKRDQIKFHVTALKDLGLKISKLEEVTDEEAADALKVAVNES